MTSIINMKTAFSERFFSGEINPLAVRIEVSFRLTLNFRHNGSNQIS